MLEQYSKSKTKKRTNEMAHTALILSMKNTFVAEIPLWLQRKLFAWLVKRGHKNNAYKGFEKYFGKPLH